MADSYRIFGAGMSPARVRCHFRSNRIPHQWRMRNGDSRTVAAVVEATGGATRPPRIRCWTRPVAPADCAPR